MSKIQRIMIENSLKEKALLCQKAEHTYGLVPCGLMDQLISIYGEGACATLIDCRFEAQLL